MKVRELIAWLGAHDPEAEVLTEGCDCWGEVDAVARVTSTDYKEPTIILLRESRDTCYLEAYEGAKEAAAEKFGPAPA